LLSWPAKSISNETDFIGVKEPLTPQRPWRIVAGPELSASAFRCAVLGGDEAVDAINGTNLKHWRVANAKAEEKTLIERHQCRNGSARRIARGDLRIGSKSKIRMRQQ
jgi:hypothetical protein